MGAPAVEEPEGKRDGEAEQVGYRYPLVAAADGEHVLGYTPGDGEGVELVRGG